MGSSTSRYELAELLTRPALEVGPRLLGSVFRVGDVAVRLTEVEAYHGQGQDPGSHAHRGRTPRTESMFAEGGTLYVYLSYGIHRCVNIVCGPEGWASGLLLRAGEVVEGVDVARSRRPSARSTGTPQYSSGSCRWQARAPERAASHSACALLTSMRDRRRRRGMVTTSTPVGPVVTSLSTAISRTR